MAGAATTIKTDDNFYISAGDSFTAGAPIFAGTGVTTNTYPVTPGVLGQFKSDKLVAGKEPVLGIQVGCRFIPITKDLRKKAERMRRMTKLAAKTQGADATFENNKITEQDVVNFIKFLDLNRIR